MSREETSPPGSGTESPAPDSQAPDTHSAGPPSTNPRSFDPKSPGPQCPGAPPEAAVFAEPWQARAFALMLKLRERGHFTANEWSTALGEALRVPTGSGATDENASYYAHWLAALESLVLAKGLTDAPSLSSRKEAWADAYRRTPHGKPVELSESTARARLPSGESR